MREQTFWTMLFGRLTWESIPLHEPILLGTFIFGFVVGRMTAGR